MKIKLTLTLIAFCLALAVCAQTRPRLTGPLAVYDMAVGYSYSDSTGIDSTNTRNIFKFGEECVIDQSDYNGLTFQQQVDTCATWHLNRIIGIILPPAEGGTPNQPADSVLYKPFVRGTGTGMIQGAHRFSVLSQLYAGYTGVVLDDWDGDVPTTSAIRDAVHGKEVDNEGNVNSESVATTPYNKVYCVFYQTGPQPDVLPYMDGLYYSLATTQNCCYAQIDSDIDTLKMNFPHKEIMIAIFLRNSLVGWTQPTGVQYMLAHLLDRYDDGDINQVNIFANVFLFQDNITLSHWDSLALPHWLDSLYYPYLGAGIGAISDCNNGHALSDVSVRVFYKERSTGDTVIRSYQRTDATGTYSYGLWAGNRNTDSSYYWLIAEKPGYLPDTAGFWIRRGDTTTIPDISMCPGIAGINKKVIEYPNPVTGICHVIITDGSIYNDPVSIYDILGRRVTEFATIDGIGSADMSTWQRGFYFLKAGDIVMKIVKE